MIQLCLPEGNLKNKERDIIQNQFNSIFKKEGKTSSENDEL